ncbi:MAG: DUF5813 family protein [Halobacteriaceae archaeon]
MPALRDAFDAHEDFARREDGVYDVTTATFEARAIVGGRRVEVVCELPTIDAAVADETVPEVVGRGWFETFERRVEGVASAVATDDVDPVTLTLAGDTVVAESTLGTDDPADAADDALAVVNFVEGTWFQGVIPGYDYVPAVQSRREAALARGGTE